MDARGDEGLLESTFSESFCDGSKPRYAAALSKSLTKKFLAWTARTKLMVQDYSAPRLASNAANKSSYVASSSNSKNNK